MPIGIGVLGTGAEGRAKNVFPDHAILISDTLGSFGGDVSHPRLHKRFDLPHQNTYVVAAGQIDRAAELVPIIDSELSHFPLNSRNYGNIQTSVTRACFNYKVERFTHSILPRYRMPPEAFDPFKATREINEVLQPEWESFGLDCDLLIASFDYKGQAFLLWVDGHDGTARPTNFPGFWAIGSGCENALFWLAYRKHNLGVTPVRSVYHAYESKLMSESDPNVNDEIDILVATAQTHWWCTSHNTQGERNMVPEFPLDRFKEMFAKYGPRDTCPLDDEDQRLVKPSNDQI